MGVVFRAHQKSLKRDVAVKMILRGELASDVDRERFRVEAEAAGRLDHPGIVPIYEVGEIEGYCYFSMKYVAGETLSERLASGPLPPRQAAEILSRVSRAVQAAHQEGILHRDLKPSNIMLDEESNPHITDFGLAKRESDNESLTRTGAVLGTPAYMAPEQAGGMRGNLGPVSDVYSLGSVLYHMLTGRPPFQAASPVDIVLLVLEQDPLPPRVVNPAVDRDLEMIALRCLQKPTDLRYSSAGALADDLDAYSNDESISARSGRMSQVMSRWFRETHHAPILQNWGMLWMWHSLALLIACWLTQWMKWQGVLQPWYYVGVWTAGLGAWAMVFWTLRRRMGPVTFVERQIAHVWAASMLSCVLLFLVEYLLKQEVLKFAPVIGLLSGSVFLVKAAILSGTFYVQALCLYATAIAMALWPNWAHAILGIVSACCFFFPGLKYHRQRIRRDS
jgi:serine/threonine-protein kinase